MSTYAQVNEIVPVDEWPRARTVVAIRLDDVPARIATWWVGQGQLSTVPR
jgi:hypothetical protein